MSKLTTIPQREVAAPDTCTAPPHSLTVHYSIGHLAPHMSNLKIALFEVMARRPLLHVNRAPVLVVESKKNVSPTSPCKYQQTQTLKTLPFYLLVSGVMGGVSSTNRTKRPIFKVKPLSSVDKSTCLRLSPFANQPFVQAWPSIKNH
jgi:hypothetical protein